MQEVDPDAHHSWFELGAEVGLDIVDEEEVEAEEDRIEEDEEVAQIYEDAKDKHRKIMTGGFKSNKYCTVTIHVEDIKDTVYAM